MPQPSAFELRNYGNGHLALVAGDVPRLDVDPYLPRRRRRRDEALEALQTGIVAITRSDAREDVTDVVDETGATVVGPRSLTDSIGRELDLEDEAVGLDDWEQIKVGPWRVINLPANGGSSVSDLVGQPADMMRNNTELLNRTLRNLPLLGEMNLGLGTLPGVGDLMGGGGHTRSVLAIELEGAPRVTLMGDSLTGAADRDWLEDLADSVRTDVLVAAVGGQRVDGLVWAVRELDPRQVVLYRDHDPYEKSQPGLAMARFIEALEEDAPEVIVQHLRDGETLQIGASNKAEKAS